MVEFNSTNVHATADNSSLWSGPQVGHGVEQEGLLFEDATGQAKLVSSEALANLFKLFSN
ncbi:MAG: hypothetical protein V7K40_21730 [Nostoc sp.]|uniref:hypothetical protein n=1 Tax=Nostoc sp. TaxID=1180 RepID=UPI002FF83053